MTWARQVLHVARKDVLMARWPLLAYVAVVVFATVTGLGLLLTGPWSMLGSSFLLVVFGMVLVAMLVQADAPTGSDAFWVTRPLRPSAVFGAKLLLMLAVIGVGVVAQALALRAHAIPGGDYLPNLSRSVLVYGLWLSAAAVLAALTRDIRMFIVVGVATLIGVSVYIMFMFSDEAVVRAAFRPEPGFRFVPPRIPPSVMLFAMLAVVAHQYLTRRLLRGIVLALVVGLVTVPVLRAPPRAPRVPPAADTPAPLHARVTEARMTFSEGGYPAVPRASVMLRLEGAAPGYRYSMQGGDAEVHRQDGSIEEAFVDVMPAWLMSVRRGRPGSAQEFVPAQIRLTSEQVEALSRGGATLRLHARIEVADVQEIGTLPLDGSTELRVDGQRLRVVRVDHGPGDGRIEVAASAVLPARGVSTAWSSGGFDWTRELTFTLADSVTGLTVPFGQSGSDGGAGTLPLPGPKSVATLLHLTPQTAVYPGYRIPRHLPSWLHVGTWRPLGSYPVQVTPTLDPRASP